MARKTNYAAVDELGRIRAKIAELKKQEDALKAEVAAMGPGAYEGALFRATVSTYETARFDASAAREKLIKEGFARWVRDHTSTAESTKVAVVSRSGRAAAA